MCKCCETIDFWKNQINTGEINCRIVIKNKRGTGSVTTKEFKMNCCPMCGRKLGDDIDE